MNCVKYSTLETFENLINLIFKNNATDRSIKFASKQIVDALVDTALTLDSKTATNS
jgi:hypothetical protein